MSHRSPLLPVFLEAAASSRREFLRAGGTIALYAALARIAPAWAQSPHAGHRGQPGSSPDAPASAGSGSAKVVNLSIDRIDLPIGGRIGQLVAVNRSLPAPLLRFREGDEVIQYHTLKPLVRDCVIVLSALANASSSSAVEIEKAFRTGALHLRAKAGPLHPVPREESGLEQLDTALDRLALAAPQIKKNVIEACVHAVGADGVIQEREVELLRAIADTLDCPIPPLVEIAES